MDRRRSRRWRLERERALAERAGGPELHGAFERSGAGEAHAGARPDVAVTAVLEVEVLDQQRAERDVADMNLE